MRVFVALLAARAGGLFPRDAWHRNSDAKTASLVWEDCVLAVAAEGLSEAAFTGR